MFDWGIFASIQGTWLTTKPEAAYSTGFLGPINSANTNGYSAVPVVLWLETRSPVSWAHPCVIYVRITHGEPSTFFSFSLSCDKTGYKQSKILYPLHWNSSYQEMECCWICAGLGLVLAKDIGSETVSVLRPQEGWHFCSFSELSVQATLLDAEDTLSWQPCCSAYSQ